MRRGKAENGGFEAIPEETERIATVVVDAAYHVHSNLGPGLLESVYEVCLCHELRTRGLDFKKQLPVPITYDGVRLDAGLRLDLLVADRLIVEIKSVEKMNPVFAAQLLTYLKLANRRLGLLINFNVRFIRDGIQRIIL